MSLINRWVVFWLVLLISASINALGLSPLKQPPYIGDFSTLKERNLVRVLVTADLGFYYVENGQSKGIAAELLTEFEKDLRKIQPSLHIQVIPVPRDKILTYLEEGFGDLAIANLTKTESREQLVDFSDPLRTGISEWVVTNKDIPTITDITQLSGKELSVRKSSSHYESILSLNKTFAKAGLEPISVHFVDETIQDYELLQMLNKGYIQAMVLDSHKADLWLNHMDTLRVHEIIPLREDAEIAWAVRENSPEIEAIVNAFIKKAKEGTLLGNILDSRYLENTDWLDKVLSPQTLSKLEQLSTLFKKYADKYHFNYLMIAALAYQESGFNNNLVSKRGAVGMMQILPSTARDANVNIKNIKNLDNNVHAGVKYLSFLRKQYFSDNSITRENQVYLTLAAYNSGPGNVEKMRKKAMQEGYNPDIWFQNVETVMRGSGFSETVNYVRNINRYYVIYSHLLRLAGEKNDTSSPNSSSSPKS
ncbi:MULTISPECIES: transglycosylase SLT domain-containing protein [Vibrio]|uniref:transglycosylase SLT domain-containing protein n=1 Tax=Vibrio TaxID=662 RepID=UPI00209C0D79|nr:MULTISPECIES: lytic transglycosylase F [unclassified Vibrio]